MDTKWTSCGVGSVTFADRNGNSRMFVARARDTLYMRDDNAAILIG